MGTIMEGGKINLAIGSYGEQLTTATPDGRCRADELHAIIVNAGETQFGSVVGPASTSLDTSTVRPPVLVHGATVNGHAPPARRCSGFADANEESRSHARPREASAKPPFNCSKDSRVARPPPKKKWIKEYFEEEPKSPVSVRVVTALPVGLRANGLVRSASPPSAPPHTAPPPAVAAPVPNPTPAPSPVTVPIPAPTSAPLLQTVHLDFAEHSRPRTNSHHGPPSIPSPPSVSSNSSGNGNGSSSGSGSGSGSAPRAGTREVHNKLEKNRRAHLKECFELLKRQLPATPDDKKTSNLSILGSAIRYIQVLRRKERECEHEMERLAREKIAAQQRLASLKREISARSTSRPRSVGALEEKDREERVNGQIVGIPITITTTAAGAVTNVGGGLRVEPSASPPRTLNLSTKLRTLPIQITPSTSQVVRTTYGARHNTLTLTALAPADVDAAVSGSVPVTATAPLHQNGQPVENGVTTTLSTALVHPAQLHLPLSQVVGGGSVVVGSAALQLLSAPGALRVLQAPALHANGVATGENSRLPIENGIVSPPPSTEGGGTSVVVNGLAPLMVSQPAAHLLQTHSLTHKMVETQVVKGAVTPLTVSAQYLSATTIVKPVVVVSGAPTGPAPPTTT